VSSTLGYYAVLRPALAGCVSDGQVLDDVLSRPWHAVQCAVWHHRVYCCFVRGVSLRGASQYSQGTPLAGLCGMALSNTPGHYAVLTPVLVGCVSDGRMIHAVWSRSCQ
jgi:hypothetical protein